MISYILIVGMTSMWITQTEVSRENNVTNTSTEPFVKRSLFLSGMTVKYADKTEEGVFPGIKVCERMIQMKTPQLVSFFTWTRYNEFFKNGRTYSIPYRATDHRYWQLMKFSFIQGKPYSQEDVEKAHPVIVLSQSMRNQYFERNENPLGKRITLDGKDYVVCGVVKDVPSSSAYAYGEYWIPYTVWQGANYSSADGLLGLYVVQVLAKSPHDFHTIHQEYTSLIQELNKENKPAYEITRGRLGTKEYLLWSKNHTSQQWALSLSDQLMHYLETLWFILIPLLALMCINFARTNERSSEIGVRMALGADKQMIRAQYIKENVLIILAGMIPGIIIGYACIYLWPDEYLDGLDVREFTSVELPYTWKVFSHLLFVFLFFLGASILIPIYKLKKQRIVNLLKGEDL